MIDYILNPRLWEEAQKVLKLPNPVYIYENKDTLSTLMMEEPQFKQYKLLEGILFEDLPIYRRA